MTRSLKSRIKKLEMSLNLTQKKLRSALVIYDANIYPGGRNLSPIHANVVIYLPDNGLWLSDKHMPQEGYKIEYS